MVEQLPVFKPTKYRRRWTPAEKFQIMREAVATSVPKAAKKFHVTERLIFSWRKQYREGKLKVS